MLLGSRVFTSSTWSRRPGRPAAEEEEVVLVVPQVGQLPRLTPWALRTMALSAACRKISVRRTMGITRCG